MLQAARLDGDPWSAAPRFGDGVAHVSRRGGPTRGGWRNTIEASNHPVGSDRRESGKTGAEALHRTVAGALVDAKAEDIVTIDLDGKTTIADLMVIASGRSKRHVDAVADRLLKQLKDDGTPALAAEGRESCDWVLIDAGDVIVHVFRPETRALYNLEKMWCVEFMGAADERAQADDEQ